MAITGRTTEVSREVEMLRGVAAGIALDYRLTDGEIKALAKWVDYHPYLSHMVPFAELRDLLSALAEGYSDGDPREQILDWCCQFGSSDSVATMTVLDATRRLHGTLHGIAADGVVTEQEVKDLRDWLLDFESFGQIWPFCQVSELVNRVLADGHLDAGEQGELLQLCRDFGGEFAPDLAPVLLDEPVSKFADSRAPHYSTLAGVCDRVPVEFLGRTFCFTGQAKTGTRNVLHELTIAKGGLPVERVTNDLHYLVIGALSNPAWAFATYGRKIERVIATRKTGGLTLIVHEDSFLATL